MSLRITLLLSILLIITSCEEKVDQAWVTVNKPGPNPETVEGQVDTVDIYVYKDSYEYLDRDLSLEQLTDEFIKLDESKTLNIKVSTDADHDRLVLLLDRMNKAGLSKFNLHTLKDDSKPISKSE